MLRTPHSEYLQKSFVYAVLYIIECCRSTSQTTLSSSLALTSLALSLSRFTKPILLILSSGILESLFLGCGCLLIWSLDLTPTRDKAPPSLNNTFNFLYVGKHAETRYMPGSATVQISKKSVEYVTSTSTSYWKKAEKRNIDVTRLLLKSQGLHVFGLK